jgi:hypothetical protein
MRKRRGDADSLGAETELSTLFSLDLTHLRAHRAGRRHNVLQ